MSLISRPRLGTAWILIPGAGCCVVVPSLQSSGEGPKVGLGVDERTPDRQNKKQGCWHKLQMSSANSQSHSGCSH
jgi:hypothetical protein